MLAMRLMILALTLASVPVPKAGSYDDGEKLTRGHGSDGYSSRGQGGRGGGVCRTARQETVFGEDGNGVDEEDDD